MKLRKLTKNEQGILNQLMQADFHGNAKIQEQIKFALVEKIDENGSLRFSVDSQSKALVLKRIPVEAIIKDADGVTVHILLHVLNGLIAELEIYKEDNSKLLEEITPSNMEIII